MALGGALKPILIVFMMVSVFSGVYVFLGIYTELFTWEDVQEFVVNPAGYIGSFEELPPGSGTETTDQQERLATTISPARDLTSSWAGALPGSFSIKEETADNFCLYTGTVELEMQQQGSQVAGQMKIENIKVETTQKQESQMDEYGLLVPPVPCGVPVAPPYISLDVVGTVSSSAISLEGYYTGFSGSFTTDLMTLYPEKCVTNAGSDCSVVRGSDSVVKLTRQN